MYTPPHFELRGEAAAAQLIDAHGFATLFTPDPAAPVATHLPLMRDVQRTDLHLLGHMARANPHWQVFEADVESLAVFHGPHSYVSPAWYATDSPAVPTWNYAAVHAYGRPVLVEDGARTAEILDLLVEQYESQRPAPWAGQLPDEFRSNLQKGIVAFEMRVTRAEAKAKLSQNRDGADRAGVAQGLLAEAGENGQQLVALANASAGDGES